MPGPPFLFGAASAAVAMVIAMMIPNDNSGYFDLSLTMPKRLRRWGVRHGLCRSSRRVSSDTELANGKLSLSDDPSAEGDVSLALHSRSEHHKDTDLLLLNHLSESDEERL